MVEVGGQINGGGAQAGEGGDGALLTHLPGQLRGDEGAPGFAEHMHFLPGKGGGVDNVQHFIGETFHGVQVAVLGV